VIQFSDNMDWIWIRNNSKDWFIAWTQCGDRQTGDIIITADYCNLYSTAVIIRLLTADDNNILMNYEIQTKLDIVN